VVSQRQLKRRILRGVIDDNLEVIEGVPRGTNERRRAGNRGIVKGGIAVVFVTALVTVGVTTWRELSASPGRTSSGATQQPRTLPVANRAAGAPTPYNAKRLVEMVSLGQAQQLFDEVIPLSVKRVAIDPGHGGRDGGTALSYGMKEKDLTLDIGYRLGLLLTQAGSEVIHTREQDVEVSLKRRAEIANEAHADVFVSIHVNWLPRREARGVETYFLGRTNDPFLTRLAAAENRDSGFSVADYRRLLEGIFSDIRQKESRQLAHGIQQALYENLKVKNPQIENRGVMTAPFVVLVATEMPAVLAEVACLSNDREARLLAIPSYRQSIAESLYLGISRFADEMNHSLQEEPEKGS